MDDRSLDGLANMRECAAHATRELNDYVQSKLAEDGHCFCDDVGVLAIIDRFFGTSCVEQALGAQSIGWAKT